MIRLHRLGQSARRIARQLSMGRNTIGQYLEVLSRAGLLEGAVDALPELDVLATLVREHDASSSQDPVPSTVAAWREEVERPRAKGAGPTAIHDHLRVIDGALCSALWKHLHQELWVRSTRSSVAIHHGDLHLWTHARVTRGQRSTVEEHLPEYPPAYRSPGATITTRPPATALQASRERVSADSSEPGESRRVAPLSPRGERAASAPRP